MLYSILRRIHTQQPTGNVSYIICIHCFAFWCFGNILFLCHSNNRFPLQEHNIIRSSGWVDTTVCCNIFPKRLYIICRHLFAVKIVNLILCTRSRVRFVDDRNQTSFPPLNPQRLIFHTQNQSWRAISK